MESHTRKFDVCTITFVRDRQLSTYIVVFTPKKTCGDRRVNVALLNVIVSFVKKDFET